MSEVVLKIIPVILIFLLGYFLKKINLLKKENGDLFLKLIFYIAMPALILISVTNIDLSLNLVYLLVIPLLIIPITYVLAYFIGNLFHLKKTSFGVFLVGSMIMNTGFTVPFIIAAFGNEGLARIALFDLANGFLTFTLVYYFACKYGNNRNDSKTLVKKFILTPPIWALVVALVLNLTSVQIPAVLNNFFQLLGALVVPFIMLSLGIYFSPKIVKFLPLSFVIIIRMLFGLFLGFIFVKLFNLEGLTKAIVLIGSSAPVGYNTLTFSSLENLDKEFAASLVSYSILTGLIFVPILMLLLS